MAEAYAVRKCPKCAIIFVPPPYVEQAVWLCSSCGTPTKHTDTPDADWDKVEVAPASDDVMRVIAENTIEAAPEYKLMQAFTALSAAQLKDSGSRREFGTGAVRDRGTGKGAFQLLPTHGLLLAAQQMERGAAKYSARNWEKGMPLSEFFNSADRHMRKFISGYDDEPHLAAAIWNLLCLAEGQERVKQGLWPKEFDDIPTTYAGKDPGF